MLLRSRSTPIAASRRSCIHGCAGISTSATRPLGFAEKATRRMIAFPDPTRRTRAIGLDIAVVRIGLRAPQGALAVWPGFERPSAGRRLRDPDEQEASATTRSRPTSRERRRSTGTSGARRGLRPNFVTNFVPNPAEISTRDNSTPLKIALQSQISITERAGKAVYTGSIPVVASEMLSAAMRGGASKPALAAGGHRPPAERD